MMCFPVTITEFDSLLRDTITYGTENLGMASLQPAKAKAIQAATTLLVRAALNWKDIIDISTGALREDLLDERLKRMVRRLRGGLLRHDSHRRIQGYEDTVPERPAPRDSDDCPSKGKRPEVQGESASSDIEQSGSGSDLPQSESYTPFSSDIEIDDSECDESPEVEDNTPFSVYNELQSDVNASLESLSLTLRDPISLDAATALGVASFDLSGCSNRFSN